ncbi:unnamed protein product [Effrenium voratum]|nr:unnamed protein product [Effrenium voratum]
MADARQAGQLPPCPSPVPPPKQRCSAHRRLILRNVIIVILWGPWGSKADSEVRVKGAKPPDCVSSAQAAESAASSAFSSSTSSSSDSCDSSSASRDVEPEPDDLFSEADSSEEEGEGQGDAIDKFPDLRSATRQLKYAGSTVHFWTVPHSDKAEAITATSSSKKVFARALVYGDSLAHYCIVTETHPSSRRGWERRMHWHAILKLTRRVKWKLLAAKLRGRGFFGHLALPQLNADFWRCLRYLVAPSLRKGQADLDPDPYFSSRFPLTEMETRMKKFFQTAFRPSDMYNTIRRLGARISSYQDLVAWAQEQRRRGDPRFEQFMARQGPKMPALFGSWQALMAKPMSDYLQREKRLQLWNAAAQAPCACPTPQRLSQALSSLMDHHQKDPGRWAFCVKKLVRLGTAAKNCNVFLYGESNAGKTGLTRTGATPCGACDQPHPMGYLAAVAGERKRVSSCEGRKVVPKTAKGEPDEAERLAFNNRFGLRWHLRVPLPSSMRGPMLKLCYGCIGCYARWIEEHCARYIEENVGVDDEVRAMENAMAWVAMPAQVTQAVIDAPAAREHSLPVPFTPPGLPPPSPEPVANMGDAEDEVLPSAPFTPPYPPPPSPEPAGSAGDEAIALAFQGPARENKGEEVAVQVAHSRRGPLAVTPLKRKQPSA